MKICVTRKSSGMNTPSAGEFIRSGATSGDVHFGSLILNLIFAALYYIKSR